MNTNLVDLLNNLENSKYINSNLPDIIPYLSSITSDISIPQTNSTEFLNSDMITLIINSLNQILSSKTNDNLLNKPSSMYSNLYNEKNFTKITDIPGLDINNPQNARQNNYAWSCADFNGYIYVGTGRNLTYSSMAGSMKGISVPLDYTPSSLDMGTEIWRYKKDGSLPWQKVFKSPIDSDTKSPKFIGIRSIIKFESFNVKPALYAAAYSRKGITILKSTNGVDWFDIPTNINVGTSSRSMIVYNNKIYLTVLADGELLPSLLYSSEDPELFGWRLETPTGEEGKNPVGTIWSIESFNNHLYLGTAGANGFMVWRTNGVYPKVNDWKLVIDNGAGDKANATALSLVKFKNYLYVGTAYNTTSFLSYIVPKGAEIISIDKNDNWKIIVGGPALNPIETTTGERTKPLSGLNNGFNNPYNIYVWQMKVYKGRLFVGTYDSTSVIEPTLELLMKNKEYLSKILGDTTVNLFITLLKLQIELLSKVKNRFGFDFYVTNDGINYKLINNNGFSNPSNYGIRNILVSDDNTMFIGTANPFTGCEVYKLKNRNSFC